MSRTKNVGRKKCGNKRGGGNKNNAQTLSQQRKKQSSASNSKSSGRRKCIVDATPQVTPQQKTKAVDYTHYPPQTLDSSEAYGSYHLTITLKSDLLAGSGEGFSSSIDTDSCLDADGYPYIPARRIKGCLREAALLVASVKERGIIDLLFGKPGNQSSGLITIADATLSPSQVRIHGCTDTVIDSYTYLRMQTKLDSETGVADPNTLRCVRVVKHWLPTGNRYPNDYVEAKFCAKVELRKYKPIKPLKNCPTDEEISQFLKTKVVPALRNIGMGRNRGFGAVQCALNLQRQPSETTEVYRQPFQDPDLGQMVALSYAVKLDSPLMISQLSGRRSAQYVPGTSVQGFFASRLIGRDDFENLLFGGKVRFSPLYPLEVRQVNEGLKVEVLSRCIPAPPFIAKAKGGLNNGCYLAGLTGFEYESGFKPVKEGFISTRNWLPVEQKVEVTYHHKTGDEPELYMQECLSAGQYLGGFVECAPEFADVLENILTSGTLTFGRSKTAQYAQCSLVGCGIDLSGRSEDPNVTLQTYNSYAYVLESDVMPAGLQSSACDSGFVVLRDELKAASHADLSDEYINDETTSIALREIGGYNAKWHQKKPHVYACAAGGGISFLAHDDTTVNRIVLLGDRKGEGFGRLRLVRAEDLESMPLPEEQRRLAQQANDVVSHAGEPSYVERCRMATISYFDANARSFDSFTPSFISRLKLMAAQATSWDEYCKADSMVEDAASVGGFVGGIRDVALRQEAASIVRGLRAELEILQNTDEGGQGDTHTERSWHVEQQCLSLLFKLARYRKRTEDEEVV